MANSSNIVNQVTGFLDKLKDLFMRGLDKLIELGLSVEEDTAAKEKAQQVENERAKKEGRKPSPIVTQFFVIHGVGQDNKGVDVSLTLTPIGSLVGKKLEDRFDAKLVFPDGDEEDKENIRSGEIDDWITAVLDKRGIGYEDAEEVKSSVKVKLQRVYGATEDNINLLAVQSRSTPAMVNQLLDTALSSDTFTDTLTEEPCTLCISDAGDQIDIYPCDEVDTECIENILLPAAFQCMNDLTAVLWNTDDCCYAQVVDVVEPLIRRVSSDIEVLGREVSRNHPVPLQPDEFSHSNPLVMCDFTDAESVLAAVKNSVKNYYDAVDLYYCNCSEALQCVLQQSLSMLQQAM